MALPTLQDIKAYDAQREGIPGEHWLTLAGGIGLWMATRHSNSLVLRTLGLLGGTALVARAASGRDGIVKLVQYLPVGQGLRR